MDVKMANRGPSKYVFVGNIPWEVTEEAMAELFREPGPLVSFRLVVDKETLKPRGYGFAEYFDIETAKSAVRNLNEYEVSGRKLRVNFADNNEILQTETESKLQEENMNESIGNFANPAIVGQSANDAISRVIDGMSQEQQLDALANVKLLSMSHPDQARNLLAANPQLSYCLMLMMLTCGLVDPVAIQRIVKSMASSGAPGAPASLSYSYPGITSGMMGVMPSGMPPIPSVPPMAVAGSNPNLVASNMLSLYPNSASMQSTIGMVHDAHPTLTDQQRQLLAQVFSLSPNQVEALPPDQRATIVQLRSQFSQFQGLFSAM